MDEEAQLDLLSDVSDYEILRYLLADLHDDLKSRLRRFRYLIDLGQLLGREGTMIFGGHAAATAYTEARSAFVNGNFIATIFLCQSLIEHVLAAFLHGGLLEEIPRKITFRQALQRCKDRGLLTDHEEQDLIRLTDLRNPLMHFQHFDEPGHLTRRSIESGELTDELLERDACFAIGVAVRILAKGPFRVGP
jgi:hypothetical protein